MTIASDSALSHSALQRFEGGILSSGLLVRVSWRCCGTPYGIQSNSNNSNISNISNNHNDDNNNQILQSARGCATSHRSPPRHAAFRLRWTANWLETYIRTIHVTIHALGGEMSFRIRSFTRAHKHVPCRPEDTRSFLASTAPFCGTVC